jgi:TRAP-type C4-dicarboxylate transport system permease small subunit
VKRADVPIGRRPSFSTKDRQMKAWYIRLMNVIHWLCLVIAGTSLVIITLIIPWGVFTRFVLNSASSWPEPMAVLLMIWLSFLSACICYREYLHIGVGLLPAFLVGASRNFLGFLIEICMLVTNLFMLWWGIQLVEATWFQSIAEFPIISAGFAYFPVPLGGLIMVLFVIERIWTQEWFLEQTIETTSTVTTE